MHINKWIHELRKMMLAHFELNYDLYKGVYTEDYVKKRFCVKNYKEKFNKGLTPEEAYDEEFIKIDSPKKDTVSDMFLGLEYSGVNDTDYTTIPSALTLDSFKI